MIKRLLNYFNMLLFTWVGMTGAVAVAGPSLPEGMVTAYIPSSEPAAVYAAAHSGVTHVMAYNVVDASGAAYPISCFGHAHQSACIEKMIAATHLYAKTAHQAGVGAIVSFKDFYLVFGNQFASVAAQVAASIRSEAGVAGFYINDEFDLLNSYASWNPGASTPSACRGSSCPPETIKVALSLLTQLSQSIREVAPSIPLIQVVSGQTQIQVMSRFGATFDLLGNDAYPVGWAPYTVVSDSMHQVGDSIAASGQSGARGFQVVQISNQTVETLAGPGGDLGFNSSYEPQVRDSRCMAYLALIHGAQNIFLYNVGDFYWDAQGSTAVAATPDEVSARFSRLSQVSVDLRDMMPLISGDSIDPTQAIVKTPAGFVGSAGLYGFGPTLANNLDAHGNGVLGAPAGLHLRTFLIGNHLYMMVVNPSKDTSLPREASRLTIKLPIPQGAAVLPSPYGSFEKSRSRWSVQSHVATLSSTEPSSNLPAGVENQITITAIGSNQYVVDANALSCGVFVW